MHTSQGVRRQHRPRLLIVAYHYDRSHSMESRLSWQRAQHAAKDYDVTVICARGDSLQRANQGDDVADQVTVIELPVGRLQGALMVHEMSFYLGYRAWHRRVYRLAQTLHRERPFALVHQVSLCGYREPSDCWRLDAPFVWGPIGGTRHFPIRFLGQLDFRGAVREVVRNVVNACQLRFGRRIRSAVKASAAVMAANRAVAQDLEHSFGCAARVQLETGVSPRGTTTRPRRDSTEPLKILWTGRLRSWKALPLLLRALAGLPSECRYQLRVLGEGNCLGRWQRLAKRLGIDAKVEWAGWSSYAEQLPHYEWADIFAFTSLRDTSGAGLLEALAAGAPVVGIDHQGAADILSESCAIRVPATSPATTIAGFREAVLRLSTDAEELERLAAGAVERSREFHWDLQWDVIHDVYQKTLIQPAPATHANYRESTTRVAVAHQAFLLTTHAGEIGEII